MAESRVIRVTPNVRKCLRILKAAAEKLPSGTSKTKAKGALLYLERTFRGVPQPRQGRNCPGGTMIIR
jgi:hypothetical protein